LYDVTGRKILVKNYSRDADGSPIKVNPPKTIAKGVYFLSVKYRTDYQLKVKIVKQ
jgi:hypothetical protein